MKRREAAPAPRVSGPVGAAAARFARMAKEADEERRRWDRNSWQHGEATGRFLAYRNAAAQLADVLGGGA